MSILASIRSEKIATFFRFKFPWLALGLAALAVSVMWAWPSRDLERYMRVAVTWLAATLGGLGLLGWFLFLGPLRWPARVTMIFAAVAAAPLAVRSVEFSGDMVPIFHFRWQPDPFDVLKAHRQGQPTGDLGPFDLSIVLPTDSPGYLGRNRDGVIDGPALNRDWTARPPRHIWKQPVGGGYAGFAVVNGALVTIEQRERQEAVVCYDAATGRERWVHEYPAYFYEPQGGAGPRATPAVADGLVYSLGATGLLVCLEGSTGTLKWAVDILADNSNLVWGMSGSPLVYDDVVVVNPGAQTDAAKGRALVAYDRTTGKQVWAAGSAKASYSSPMLATIAGQRQILLFDGEGLAGYDPAGAGELWRFPWKTISDIHVAQPIVLPGDRVLISSGLGTGSGLLQIRNGDGKWSVEPVWQNRSLRCRFTTPVCRGDHVYGLDEGILVCLDVRDGRRAWKDGRYGNGQLLLTGDLLVIMTEDGDLALVEATPEAFRELGRIQHALDGDKTWNIPTLADGKVYLRNHHQMACFDLAP